MWEAVAAAHTWEAVAAISPAVGSLEQAGSLIGKNVEAELV
eukprot:SAG11_NODE_37100_length_258_cov_0.974843_1_plen_40_part_01